MAGNTRNDLVSALRGKLSDDRASVAAFSIAVTANAKSALLEITNGFFVVTVEQGEAPSVRFNLSDPRYATIGRLSNELAKVKGYAVVADSTMHEDHASTDLRVDGMQDISPKKSYTLKHHVWSEQELADILLNACSLHNPNYATLISVPKNEHPFVLMKAAAEAFRQLASDSVRRKGLEADTNALLRLASDLERQYTNDLERLSRVVPVPKADESKMGPGDTVVGTLVRRSLRAGYTAPHRPAGNVHPPKMLDPADDDVEDTIARVRWQQMREQRFAYVELWRDTQPNVERCISGKLDQAGSSAPMLSAGTQYAKAGTSKQVLGVHSGASLVSPTFDGFFFWTAAELAGANVIMSTFIDGYIPAGVTGGLAVALGDPLEPETDYYYRLYAIDWNGEILPSEVKRIRTRPMKAQFKRDANGALAADAISPQTGVLAGGTAIVIKGKNFTAGTKVLVNGKEASFNLDSSTQLTATSPAFTNEQWIGRFVDIVLVSPNGLRDIAIRGWKYT